MRFLFNFSLCLFFLMVRICNAEEYIIERGETCLQIAIDHNLTMEQLQRLNPDTDLEMMMVGDKLVIPDEGFSFDEFLALQYSQLLTITDGQCDITADGAALCFFFANNISEFPLFDVDLRVTATDLNGFKNYADADIPLMQILPDEKLPAAAIIPGDFYEISDVEFSIKNIRFSEKINSSFRIPQTYYKQNDLLSPDRVAAASTIQFTQEGEEIYRDKKINVFSAAFDAEKKLIGVRSLFSDFYPRLDITVYSAGHEIAFVELRIEAY